MRMDTIEGFERERAEKICLLRFRPFNEIRGASFSIGFQCRGW